MRDLSVTNKRMMDSYSSWAVYWRNQWKLSGYCDQAAKAKADSYQASADSILQAAPLVKKG